MRIFGTVVFLVFMGSFSLLRGAEAEAADPVVVVDYFFEPGCPACLKVRNRVLPEIEERFEGFFKINRYNVHEVTNVALLLSYREKLDVTDNKSVMMVVDYAYVLNGYPEIRDGLRSAIDEALAERLDPAGVPPAPIQVDTGDSGGTMKLLTGRVEGFTLWAVILGGLGDGFNPCAMATLVFFVSLLGAYHVGNRAVAILGISFCVAVFVTYTAIGYGLLQVIHKTLAFETARRVFEVVMTAVLAVLALMSFRDAARYARSGKAGDVTLQLPEKLKRLAHSVLRKGIRARNLVVGGFVAGMVVTAIETVCTSQTYVPVLAAVAKSESALSGRAWGYLLLYNGMFVVPLVVILVLAYMGMKTDTLIEWSKKNVVVSKVMMGMFFVAMGVLIWML